MSVSVDQPLRIVGIGGTTDPGSSTETALQLALAAAAELGAVTELFDGEFLTRLPHFGTPQARDSEDARHFLTGIRAADGADPGQSGLSWFGFRDC